MLSFTHTDRYYKAVQKTVPICGKLNEHQQKVVKPSESTMFNVLCVLSVKNDMYRCMTLNSDKRHFG